MMRGLANLLTGGELDRLRATNERLRRDYSGLLASVAGVEDERDAARNALANLGTERDGLQNQVDGLKRTIVDLEAHRDRAIESVTQYCKLGFTHFKRRKRGNLQVGGIERWGVPACRGWLRTVKNPLTPATGGVAPGRWRPRRWATACRTRPPCVGSWGAVFATRGRPGWSRRRAPAGRAWCGRWRDRTTGVGSPHPGGFAPPER